MNRIYCAIDLKSFYASVECVERGLDPLNTNLVVADNSRTEKTICLAVTPPLKEYGVSGRPRLFEVIQKVKEINRQRKIKNGSRDFKGKSYLASELNSNPSLELDYLVTPPRMAHYIKYSAKIYEIYLKYIAPKDIHIYSIDEVFIDLTNYISLYKMSAHDIVRMIIQDVIAQTGITSTAGIGTNLYLAKVAMDIVAKKIAPDKDGVRIAELDIIEYRKKLWDYKPITKFWRVGKGYANKLASHGMFTMGDIARKSIENEELLFKIFGKNAELLIDHAWGIEPCTIADIKKYRPSSNSVGSGQVLHDPYTFKNARIVAWEMVELLSLDLVSKRIVTNQIKLTVDYDAENLKRAEIVKEFKGDIEVDSYGRKKPKYAHGTYNLEEYTSSTHILCNGIVKLFDRVVNPKLLIRKIYVTFCNVIPENIGEQKNNKSEQLNLFTNYMEVKKEKEEEEKTRFLKKERKVQETILNIKDKFGKNAILKGKNLVDGATAKDKNNQIGGHKA